MNKKITTYLLMIVAVAVWGVIVYKIMQAVNGNETTIITQEDKSDIKPEKTAEADTFSISLNYVDPFFNKISGANNTNYSSNYYSEGTGSHTRNNPIEKQEAQNNSSTTTVKPKAKTPSVKPTDWGFISFTGLIKNAQTKALVALINIHQKGHMMKEGDSYEGVKLIKAYKDSVIVQYLNEKKTINKK